MENNNYINPRNTFSALSEKPGENKKDVKALFSIVYGLYVVTSLYEGKPNGLVLNSVFQVTNTPDRIAVTINKTNYSHKTVKETGIMNVNCLTTEAPFSLFQNFGFQSGKSKDKFKDVPYTPDKSGLPVLNNYVNAFLSLKAVNYIDLSTHGMFICEVTESSIINNKETMTYSYYHKNVKPNPEKAPPKGYVCKICGYVYKGEALPEDFICPVCKHPASDFEKL